MTTVRRPKPKPPPLWFSLLAITSVAFVLSWWIESPLDYLSGAFWSLAGILAATTVATSIFFIQSADSIRERITAALLKGNLIIETDVSQIRKIFSDVKKEVIEDCAAVLLALVVMFGALLLDASDLPMLGWPESWAYTKSNAVHAVNLAGALLLLGCCFDTILTILLSVQMESFVESN